VTPERWQAVQRAFAAVLEAPPGQRDDAIRAACGDDAELLREVRSLLAADADASRLIAAAAPPAGPTVPVGMRVGEYELRGLLGQGGMGTVYTGVHPVIGKEVAIKVLDPRLASTDGIVDRFVREARAVNKIRHPNIIDIFAFGYAPSLGHYFVMPRLVGETLGARVARQPLGLVEAVPVFEQIADALDAAHGAGVLHRDLKPDNIFLVADRRGRITVQLLDFGIAKLLDGDAAVTRSGIQMGTPLFMSPEQWEGVDVDQRTDVYALGVMLHHALTGRYPFEATSPIVLMNMHATRTPIAPSAHGAPAAIDPVIARALAKSRHDRQASAGELYTELAAVAGVSVAGETRPAVVRAPGPIVVTAGGTPAVAPVTTLSGSIGVDERPASSRSRMVLGLGGLLATGAVVAVAAIAMTGRDPDPAGATAPADAAAAPVVAAPDAAPAIRAAPVDAVPAPIIDGPRSRRRIDAAPAATPRPAPDAAPRPRTAPPRSPPDAGWGTTINPFPDTP
jgi:serine/threonine-protein kinase